MRPLLSSAVGKRMKGVMLLEFSGRRSGKTFKVPVNLHRVDGGAMAFTDRPWRLNFEGGAPVKLTYLGRVRKTTGTLVPMTPAQMGVAVRESLDNGDLPNGWVSERRGASSLPRRTSPLPEPPSGPR